MLTPHLSQTGEKVSNLGTEITTAASYSFPKNLHTEHILCTDAALESERWKGKFSITCLFRLTKNQVFNILSLQGLWLSNWSSRTLVPINQFDEIFFRMETPIPRQEYSSSWIKAWWSQTTRIEHGPWTDVKMDKMFLQARWIWSNFLILRHSSPGCCTQRLVNLDEVSSQQKEPNTFSLQSLIVGWTINDLYWSSWLPFRRKNTEQTGEETHDQPRDADRLAHIRPIRKPPSCTNSPQRLSECLFIRLNSRPRSSSATLFRAVKKYQQAEKDCNQCWHFYTAIIPTSALHAETHVQEWNVVK